MSKVNDALKSDDVKEYLALTTLCSRALRITRLPEQEKESIEEPVADDRVSFLEDKIIQMEAEQQVDKDIASLVGSS